MGLLGCTFRDRGQDLADFQGLQAACGDSKEHDTAIVARKGMARKRTCAGGGEAAVGELDRCLSPDLTSVPFLLWNAQ